MLFSPELDNNAKLVLRTVAERDMDGFTLARHTRLDLPVLEKAVRDLESIDLLRIKGEPAGEQFFEAWFQAVPGAMRLISASR